MHIVADIGNTRMKWGQCGHDAVALFASVSPDDPDSWRGQLAAWKCERGLTWTVAGSHPARRDRFARWLLDRGDITTVIDKYQQIPLEIKLPRPEQVGLDRLLNAFAAKSIIRAGDPAIIVSAGSAVTVDLLDDTGAFAGGAIFPGLRLMAQSLHEHTALLPLIDSPAATPLTPGKNTEAAIQAGIFWAVAGGVAALARSISLQAPSLDRTRVFFTGGDAPRFEFCDFLDRMQFQLEFHPKLTLEGIRLVSLAITNEATR
jgi:type III pantothenate kinase